MMLPRFIVFVFAAIALAGCCASGTGCPVNLPPNLATSDGLVSSRDGGLQPDEPSMGRTGRSNSAMMTEPGMEPRRDTRQNAKRSYEEQVAEDREADAALTRHLKICNGCGPSGRGTMATTDSMGDRMDAGRAAATSRPKTREMSDTVD
jgi:hypothetical protein